MRWSRGALGRVPRFAHRRVPGGHFPFRDDAEAYRAAVDALVTEAVHDYQEERNR